MWDNPESIVVSEKQGESAMSIQSFKDLIVWQKAMDLVELVYRLLTHFPKEELYGLSSQIKRAVISIPSNIAEGQARTTRNDFPNFLSIARGSCAEVETQLLIAERLGILTKEQICDALDKIQEITRILNSLINKMSI